MPCIKHSRQRDAILNNLRSRYDHPTADELYLSLKKEFPNISLATVYRNLNMLCENGIIQKIVSDDVDRFDAQIKVHYHMTCNICKKVFDIEMPVIDNLNEQAQKYVKGTVETHTIMFNGICENCQKK